MVMNFMVDGGCMLQVFQLFPEYPVLAGVGNMLQT